MNHNQHLYSSIISLIFLFKRSKSEGPAPFVLGFPNDKESACQGKRCEFVAWVGKISWRRAWQPTPAFLPRESLGKRSLVGYSPQGRKELDTTEVTKHAFMGRRKGWAQSRSLAMRPCGHLATRRWWQCEQRRMGVDLREAGSARLGSL